MTREMGKRKREGRAMRRIDTCPICNEAPHYLPAVIHGLVSILHLKDAPIRGVGADRKIILW